MEESLIPHVSVSVEYKGDTVQHHGGQFFEAISFLVHCAEAIQKKEGLKDFVDVRTSSLQHENMRRLLEGMKQ